MNKVDVLFTEFEIDSLPLEDIKIEKGFFCVYLNDINEKRYKIKFGPYIAVKITAIDYMTATDFYNNYCYRDGIYHRHLLQIENSEWIKMLGKNLAGEDMRIQSTLEFNHYVLPLYEDVIEILSGDIKIEEV